MSSIGDIVKSKINVVNKQNPTIKVGTKNEPNYICKINDELKIISINLYNYKTGIFFIVKNNKNDSFTIDENDVSNKNDFSFGDKKDYLNFKF